MSPNASKRSVMFSETHLSFLNERLAKLSPQKILEWAIVTLPGLYQTTAFGLTGLVILDMISKITHEQAEENGTEPKHLVPLIFLDTLYHFPQTIALSKKAASTYNAPLHTVRPLNCENAQEFEAQYGTKLWEADEASYDYLVKVEPSRIVYEQLGVQAVITGRRRSQRGERGNINIVEVEKETGLIKLNPLALWDFDRVRAYVRANEVPYNPLLDQGYRSIGDWHSTKPTKDSTNERSGRWEGRQKTECGLHKDYFKMRAAFLAAQKKKELMENTRILNHTMS